MKFVLSAFMLLLVCMGALADGVQGKVKCEGLDEKTCKDTDHEKYCRW